MAALSPELMAQLQAQGMGGIAGAGGGTMGSLASGPWDAGWQGAAANPPTLPPQDAPPLVPVPGPNQPSYPQQPTVPPDRLPPGRSDVGGGDYAGLSPQLMEQMGLGGGKGGGWQEAANRPPNTQPPPPVLDPAYGVPTQPVGPNVPGQGEPINPLMPFPTPNYPDPGTYNPGRGSEVQDPVLEPETGGGGNQYAGLSPQLMEQLGIGKGGGFEREMPRDPYTGGPVFENPQTQRPYTPEIDQPSVWHGPDESQAGYPTPPSQGAGLTGGNQDTLTDADRAARDYLEGIQPDQSIPDYLRGRYPSGGQTPIEQTPTQQTGSGIGSDYVRGGGAGDWPTAMTPDQLSPDTSTRTAGLDTSGMSDALKAQLGLGGATPGGGGVQLQPDQGYTSVPPDQGYADIPADGGYTPIQADQGYTPVQQYQPQPIEQQPIPILQAGADTSWMSPALQQQLGGYTPNFDQSFGDVNPGGGFPIDRFGGGGGGGGDGYTGSTYSQPIQEGSFDAPAQRNDLIAQRTATARGSNMEAILAAGAALNRDMLRTGQPAETIYPGGIGPGGVELAPGASGVPPSYVIGPGGTQMVNYIPGSSYNAMGLTSIYS